MYERFTSAAIVTIHAITNTIDTGRVIARGNVLNRIKHLWYCGAVEALVTVLHGATPSDRRLAARAGRFGLRSSSIRCASARSVCRSADAPRNRVRHQAVIGSRCQTVAADETGRSAADIERSVRLLALAAAGTRRADRIADVGLHARQLSGQTDLDAQSAGAVFQRQRRGGLGPGRCDRTGRAGSRARRQLLHARRDVVGPTNHSATAAMPHVPLRIL